MNRFLSRSLFIALPIVCCFSFRAIAQNDSEELERAFAASFALVPEVARSHAGPACSKHSRQAAEVGRARDSGLGRAAALALLAPPPNPSADAEDKRVDAAVLRANTAIVAFVFGTRRPTPELAREIINGACLLGAGQATGQIRI